MSLTIFRATAKPLSGRYLSLAEREEIALLLVQNYSLLPTPWPFRRRWRVISPVSGKLLPGFGMKV
jgi:hypothetical protein